MYFHQDPRRGHSMKKPISDNIDYASLAQGLRDLAKAVKLLPPGSVAERESLRTAAEAVCRALADDARSPSAEDTGDLTPEEEVQLLHILE
jgi:hypothetical protein